MQRYKKLGLVKNWNCLVIHLDHGVFVVAGNFQVDLPLSVITLGLILVKPVIASVFIDPLEHVGIVFQPNLIEVHLEPQTPLHLGHKMLLDVVI